MWNSVEEACRSSIKQTEKVSPNRKSAANYEPFYRTYDKLYFDLKERFREIAGLAQ